MADNLDPRGKSSGAAGWLASLEAQDVRCLILDVHSDQDLLQEARRRPGWRLDFDDGDSAVCVRQVAESLPRRGES